MGRKKTGRITSFWPRGMLWWRVWTSSLVPSSQVHPSVLLHTAPSVFSLMGKCVKVMSLLTCISTALLLLTQEIGNSLGCSALPCRMLASSSALLPPTPHHICCPSGCPAVSQPQEVCSALPCQQRPLHPTLPTHPTSPDPALKEAGHPHLCAITCHEHGSVGALGTHCGHLLL